MSKDQMIQILSMGYRKMKEKVWGKPFGNTMFVINEQEHTVIMTIYLKASDESYTIWTYKKINTKRFSIEDIKDFECEFCGHWFANSEFHFLSNKEIIENNLY